MATLFCALVELGARGRINIDLAGEITCVYIVRQGIHSGLSLKYEKTLPKGRVEESLSFLLCLKH